MNERYERQKGTYIDRRKGTYIDRRKSTYIDRQINIFMEDIWTDAQAGQPDRHTYRQTESERDRNVERLSTKKDR